MKTRKSFKIIVGTSLLFFMCAFLFLILPNAANALGENNKKQLKTCTVTDGDVVVQIGNTCNSGGEGCTANPCNQ